MERKSNYDIFKRDALKRFLTYDMDAITKRLDLESDEDYIYMPFCDRFYRIGRQNPSMEWKKGEEWIEADSNAVLTICDLLCHTSESIQLSGTYKTIQSLNRVKGGSSTILGGSFFDNTAKFFDGKCASFKAACEKMGGIPVGKGDVAYRIPMFGDVAMQFSYYESDDEFPAALTFFYDEKICDYLFYETIWYNCRLILDRIKELMKEYNKGE